MKIAELLRSLSEGQVQYVLVGGLAVQLHGYMRSTFDIDLVLAMNDENLVRFIGVAKQYGLSAEKIPMIDEKVRMTIPEEVLRARLAQSEQMREFFIEMWKQNPALAKQGGARVQSLLTPLAGVKGSDA